MKTLKGPAIFLAQFVGEDAPFNNLPSIAKWAAGLGYKGIQVPTWDKRLFNLDQAAASRDYCDEVAGIVADAGLVITELSTHLQGQLVAVQSGVGELRTLAEPTRAYDSRTAGVSGRLVIGTPRAVDLSASVPAGARAALVTVTVTQTEGGGFVTAYSNALTTTPATSTVNWTAPNSDVATTTTVAVSDSKIKLLAGQNSTHVIVDVIGYYL
jgi:hypothetical protein